MRYILTVLAVVFILIASIFWLRSGTPDDSQQQEDIVVLTDYVDSSARVVYELHGELVGDDQRQAIRITIDRNQRVFEVLDGYRRDVVQKETFNNNPAAFEEFMYGLERAGFTNDKEPQFDTEKGVCPNGNITIYKLSEKSDDISRLWSASCDEDLGSFDGNERTVEDLFEDQIPEYRDLVRDLEI